MAKWYDAVRCTGCSACAAVCPRQCIRMRPDSEGFLRPSVQEDRCAQCGLCEQLCPALRPLAPESGPTVAYAGKHRQASVRRRSTSGGIFWLLAQWVLARGGVVFGAVYAPDFSVVHSRAESEAELEAMQGAKYAQSNLGDSLQQVKKLLEEGRYVLFSGTPCQIAGLHAYLGGAHQRLLSVDLICHGVPSPAVWQQYVASRSRLDAGGERPDEIRLRSKVTGWSRYSVQFSYPHGSYRRPAGEDPYIRGFVGDLYLRPSCYDCRYKGIDRLSDFTLGDYWGIWNQLPEFQDELGVSLVLLHSPKAAELWREISPQLEFQPVDPQGAVAENPAAVASAKANPNREAFFSRYRREDFESLVGELLPVSSSRDAKNFWLQIRKVIKKLIK